MKTIIIGNKTEGNFYTIRGFGIPSIDPAETRKAVDPLLYDSAPAKELREVSRSIGLKNQELTKNTKALRKAKARRNQTEIVAVAAERTLVEDDLRRYRARVKELKGAITAEKNDLLESQKVYFTPGPGEIIITDEMAIEYTDKITVTPEGEVFCVELADGRFSIVGTGYKKAPL